ncbi:MAG: polyphosphate kinase 1 [Oscillospiraceae bacterium]|nr:polyphosphate kinase 1 [Oscillospiraceae bacterium]
MDTSLSEAGNALTDEMLRKCMQNRELSWLQFNERVLEEADKPENPLFERFFFLSIFTSNLDEFYMIRVGGLCDHELNKTGVTDNKTGMGASEQLALIYEATVRLYAKRDAVCKKLEAELAEEGIGRLAVQGAAASITKKHQRLLDAYFDSQIQPLLAPQIIDQSHPFPHLENNRQIIALYLEAKGGKAVFGIIPVPNGAERMFFLSEDLYILLEDIILLYCEKVFKRYKVVEKAVICVTRNADIVADEERFDEDEDFIEHMSKILKKRRRLSPVRLEARDGNCPKIVSYLQKKLSLAPAQTFYCTSPLVMSHLMTFRDKMAPYIRPKAAPLLQKKEHVYPPFEPAAAQYAVLNGEMMRRVRFGDVLLYHPYDSIQPFFSLIREAAEDRHVISIQITLYRIAEQSKLVEHLILAAENGKEVYVFIELRARMDEENNIVWAKRMEEAGCHVFFGPQGFKLHAKICLITRHEGQKNEYITHIGTGNYNEKTARLYTDVSIITANEQVGRDAAHFFNNMKIGAHDDGGAYELFWVAPDGFKTELIRHIERESAYADRGRITIKCNSLTDRDVIIALVKASMAGTKIDLIVRGICCLTARMPGLTDNIRVRSIVGRFLEHARVYRFGSGEDCSIYIGSGDMMTRNTERRVELFTPVLDQGARKRVSAMLDVMLADNVKAREMDGDGRYAHVKAGVATEQEVVAVDQEVAAAEQEVAVAQARDTEQEGDAAGQEGDVAVRDDDAAPELWAAGAVAARLWSAGAATATAEAALICDAPQTGYVPPVSAMLDSQQYFITEASENSVIENNKTYTKRYSADSFIRRLLSLFRVNRKA